MKSWRLAVGVGLVCLIVSAVVWAQGKAATDMESQIRKATFSYYIGLILGEPDEYFKGVKTPLLVTNDGVSQPRDEKYLRDMIGTIKKRTSAAKFTDDDRKNIVKNIFGAVDDSSVQFVGADTATISFVVQHDEKKMSDRMCSLLLHREGKDKPEWKIIQEITDSKPVPPEYLK
ncbi:MAG: hypothetical protein ABJA67_01640 [Chthonomonadales bacterium]